MTYLISIMIRGCDFDGGRQVEDDSFLSCASFPPCGLHRLTDFQSEVGLRLGKRLWAVLVFENSAVFCSALFCQLSYKLRVLDGQFDGLFPRIAENNISECRRCSVIHMQDGVL